MRSKSVSAGPYRHEGRRSQATWSPETETYRDSHATRSIDLGEGATALTDESFRPIGIVVDDPDPITAEFDRYHPTAVTPDGSTGFIATELAPGTHGSPGARRRAPGVRREIELIERRSDQRGAWSPGAAMVSS